MYQINKTLDGLINVDPNDIIIISDLDEIPNLEETNFQNINKKLMPFKSFI